MNTVMRDVASDGIFLCVSICKARKYPANHGSKMDDGICLEGMPLLTDAALKALRPREKSYKITDRAGMYVLVSPAGTLSFRLDYRLHGRRETVVLGKHSPTGLSLARAREKCIDARRAIGFSCDREAAREAASP
jgi:hypothetical protein